MSDFKKYIRRIIIAALIIIFCFLLQTAVFSNLELAGVCPNIMICVVSTYGFMKGSKKGILIGFFSGILIDVFSGFYFGFFALIFLFIGYLNGFFKKLFYGDDLKLPLVLIGTSDLLYGVICYLTLFLFRNRYHFSFYLSNIILPEVVYTELIAIFIYYLILKINNKLDDMEKKGSDHFGTFKGII